MNIKGERFGYSLSNGLFNASIVKIAVGWKRREIGRFSEVVGQTIKVKLAGHFKANDLRNPAKVLASFDFNTITGTDRDVEVLADAPEATANAPCTAQNTP
jgi:hypothetical protein